ncbi:translation machinery-associated protein 16 [Ophidiomyces ophidiicola]|nr:translation machinery-associated protein 16 [Ophidiomyces ophidiicola]
MAKNLQKVQKQISKKRGALDALHANSRDSRRLRRASAREIKLARVAAEHVTGRQIYLDRVSFFKSYITEITIPLSDNDMSQLIDKYLARYTSELTQLRQERRRGRPPSRREGVLSQQEVVEAREFSTGFWLPDLGSVDNLRKLKAWNGDWSAMSNLDFLRLRTDGSKQRSMFPPN